MESLGLTGGILMQGSTFGVRRGIFLSRNLIIHLAALNIFAALLCPMMKIVNTGPGSRRNKVKGWLITEDCS